MPDLQTQESPTPASASAATPAPQGPANGNGTASPNGDAKEAKGAPVEESFTRVDPNTLPPQLRQAYDNMLRDYKSKTGELSEKTKSEVAKAVEAYKQKAETYDQIVQQEAFVKQWNEYVQKANQTPNNGQPLDKVAELEKNFQKLQQEIQVTKIDQFIDAWSKATDDKGAVLRPEWEKLESLEIPGADDSLLNMVINKAPGNTLEEKLQNGYEAAKKVYDAIFEEGKKSTITRMTERVRSSTAAPSKSGPAGSYAYDPKNPPSAKEARELAEKGIRLRG